MLMMDDGSTTKDTKDTKGMKFKGQVDDLKTLLSFVAFVVQLPFVALCRFSIFGD